MQAAEVAAAPKAEAVNKKKGEKKSTRKQAGH
jgi:hypothetical protein